MSNANPKQFRFHETVDEEGSVFCVVEGDPIHGEAIHTCRDGYFAATLCDCLNRYARPAPPESSPAPAPSQETTPGADDSMGDPLAWMLAAAEARNTNPKARTVDLKFTRATLEMWVERARAKVAAPAPSPVGDWTDPGHRLTEIEMDVIVKAFLEAKYAPGPYSYRDGLEAAVRAFLAYQRKASPAPALDPHWVMTQCNRALLAAKDGAVAWRDGLQIIATKAAECAAAAEAPAPALGDLREAEAPSPAVFEALVVYLEGQITSGRVTEIDLTDQLLDLIAEARSMLVLPAAPSPVREALTWTKEKPKVPGWYWRRHPATMDAEAINLVADETGALFEPAEYVDQIVTMDEMTPMLQWAGPIPEPSPKEAT